MSQTPASGPLGPSVADALAQVGGPDGLRDALADAAQEESAGQAIAVAGGAVVVAEALVVVAEATSLSTDSPERVAFSEDVKEAIQAAGGPAAIASALASASTHPIIAEAMNIMGGPERLGQDLEGLVDPTT